MMQERVSLHRHRRNKRSIIAPAVRWFHCILLLVLAFGVIREVSRNAVATGKSSCNRDKLIESVRSKIFQENDSQNWAHHSNNLPGLVGLAKAEFLLQHPYATKLPQVITYCEQELVKNHTMIYGDVVLSHDYLDDLLPLAVPEQVTNIMLRSDTGEKSVIIDVGANVGQFAIPLAQHGHIVYSFEPVESSCLTLKKNLIAKKVEANVYVTCAGIDAKADVKYFGYTGDVEQPSASYSIVDPKDPNTHVKSFIQVGPVQSFLRGSRELKSIQLFKTDTQGNEEAVIRGAKTLLHRSNPGRARFLVVEYSWGLLSKMKTDHKHLLELIYEYGYVCTHLAYHHTVEIGKYDVVDTPFMRRSGPTIAYDELVQSIGKHSNWKKDHELLPDKVQGTPGWTDLLCFG